MKSLGQKQLPAKIVVAKAPPTADANEREQVLKVAGKMAASTETREAAMDSALPATQKAISNARTGSRQRARRDERQRAAAEKTRQEKKPARNPPPL